LLSYGILGEKRSVLPGVIGLLVTEQATARVICAVEEGLSPLFGASDSMQGERAASDAIGSFVSLTDSAAG